MMTGDSQGIVKSWALDGIVDALEQGCEDGELAENAVASVGAWRAHSGAISSIATVANKPEFLLTSSHDCTVAMWSVHGAHVGTFGLVHLCYRISCC